MEWYFVDNGQPQGPNSFEELQKFHRERRIQDQTLCWKEGLPEWKPFSSLVGEFGPRSSPIATSLSSASPFNTGSSTVFASSAVSSTSSSGSSTLGLIEAPGAQSVFSLPSTRSDGQAQMEIRERPCVQCRAIFSEEEMLRYQNYWVCAACKPVFLEAISEGVVSRGRLTYATGVSRVGAYFIDTLFVSVVTMPISFLIQGISLTASFKSGHFEQAAPLLQLFSILFGFSFLFLYYFGSIALSQSTPGLLFFGIRIVRADGSKMSLLQGLAWTLCSVICIYTCNLLAISTYFDPEKRAIQEFIVNNRLVYKRN